MSSSMSEMLPCVSCDEPTNDLSRVCSKCYRNPETNGCTSCGKHLAGIPYPFVCGACIEPVGANPGKQMSDKDMAEKLACEFGSGKAKLLMEMFGDRIVELERQVETLSKELCEHRRDHLREEHREQMRKAYEGYLKNE